MVKILEEVSPGTTSPPCFISKLWTVRSLRSEFVQLFAVVFDIESRAPLQSMYFVLPFTAEISWRSTKVFSQFTLKWLMTSVRDEFQYIFAYDAIPYVLRNARLASSCSNQYSFEKICLFHIENLKFHIELTHDVRFEDRAWLHELVLFQYPMSKGAEQRSSWSEFRFLAPNGSKWVANLLANYERVVVTYFLAYDNLIRSRGRSHVVRWSVVGLCRMDGAQ